MSKYRVLYSRIARWGIYDGYVLVEGGFFSKAAAEEYLRKERKDELS